MTLLHCRDETGAGFDLVPGSTTMGIRERGSYSIAIPFHGARLYIDEEPVGHQANHWTWQPGFYAGRVVAELVDQLGVRVADYMIDVAPNATKMGSEIFERMLDDLYAFDPELLLGSEAAQGRFGASGDAVSPLVAYSRLRRYGEPLIASLRDISRQPLARLRRERRLVPYHRVRRLDAASARAILGNPAAVALVERDEVAQGGKLPLFDVLQSTDDLDNPANRTMAAMLLSVRRRCIQTADGLRKLAENEEASGTRTPLQPRLSRKLAFLDAVVHGLSNALRQEPFVSVTRPEVTAAGLNSTSAHPAYARAYRFAWLVLRFGIDGADRDENIWLSPTWEIYERWCFTRVVDALKVVFDGLDWRLVRRGAAVDGLRANGVGKGTAVDLWLQPQFRAGDSAGGDFRSVSGMLCPDLLVTVEKAGSQRALVLDAKYRTSRSNVLNAMRSAHLYHDALRWRGRRLDASLLLVPRGGGAPWLEDEAFQRDHGVGIAVLAPDEISGPESLLRRWLTEHPH